MSLPQLENLRSAYVVLTERVHVALRTQLGDAARLDHHRRETLLFMQAAEQVS